MLAPILQSEHPGIIDGNPLLWDMHFSVLLTLQKKEDVKSIPPKKVKVS